MYRQVFANRWIALLFVVMTAAGAASLVGTEDTDGALDRAKAQIESRNSEFEAEAKKLSGKPSTDRSADDDVIEFTSDEELIDTAEGEDAGGFDPTPDALEVVDPSPDHTPEPALADGEQEGMVEDDGAG